MTAVAIHQPNYVPWLGYFHKMARADFFVLLDDVQFSKGSYTNRAQILGANEPRWLTVPVAARLGTKIRDVEIARRDWARRHLDALRGAYAKAAVFKSVWPEIEVLYDSLAEQNLAAINRTLIEGLARGLGIQSEFVLSSQIDTGALCGDERLVAIVDRLAPRGTYLSGKGGGTYQDPDKFANAGITLTYTDFIHPTYAQGHADFVPGLSVLDAVFHLGWDGAASLLRS